MKLNSHNEWDTLKEIIVGTSRARASLILPNDYNEALEKRAVEIAQESYPDWLIQGIEDDLGFLCDSLKDFGTKVYRPNDGNIHEIFSTPIFTASSECVYNARDLVLIVGDTIIESPSPTKYRYFESQSYYDIFYEYFKDGCKWISGPKPILKGDTYIKFYEDEKEYSLLTENEILFDAANTVRMGKDLLYLVSKSGNYLGAKWLQSILGDEYKVHTTEKIYRSSHIDSTVLCLRPKLVLFNASRVNELNCPEIFQSWEKIWFKDILPYPQEILDIHRTLRVNKYMELKKLGVDSNLNSISSEWIGLNFLSLDKETIIVDKIQTKLIDLLKSKGFNCIPISFRYSYFMGGIHCCTLDTVRDSKLESYAE